MAFRAEVILAIAEGLSNKAVAERVGTRPATVSKWRGRFAQEGVSGLRDASRSGKPRQYQDEHEWRILAGMSRRRRGTGAGTATLIASPRTSLAAFGR
jgi:transposase